MALGWTFLLVLSKYKFLKSYFTGKEGRRDCTLLYYCVQSSDYLRCVDILNHKITPLIRLLIIQKCPMRKQMLSQEFRQNNIKSLRKLVNYHSPIVFMSIYIYLFSKRTCLTTVLYFIILCFAQYEIEISWFCAISHYFISPLARERNQTN